MLSKNRKWLHTLAFVLLSASAVSCGDGIMDEVGGADTNGDLDQVGELPPDDGFADQLDVDQGVKLIVVQPKAAAVVSPQSNVQVQAKLVPAPSGDLTFEITDEGGAVLASGDVTDTTDFGADIPAPTEPGAHKWKIEVKDKTTGETVATAEITFLVNTLPTAPQVSIQPKPASAKDSLTVQLDKPAKDDDGQTITYTYAWTKDGQPTGETGESLPQGLAKKGETWTVIVVASDGVGQSPAATATIVVGNAAPDPAALAAMATEVSIDGAIQATEAGPATDIDGDTLTITWVWTVDGEVVPGVHGPAATVAELAQALGKPINAGAEIGVAQQVSDGEATATSDVSKVTVVGGTACSALALAPHVVCTENGTSDPVLSCDSETLGDGVICVVVTGLPKDATPVVASSETLPIGLSAGPPVDGPFDLEVVDENGNVVGSAVFATIGDVQTVQAKPATPGLNTLTVLVRKDGKVVGTWTADVYLNTPPTAPDVAIQPNPAQAGEALTAKITLPSQDIDSSLAQPITYSYVWTVNGKPTSYSGDTVPAGVVAKGELWQVTVTPSDGVENGPSASSFLTVGNAPPNTPVLAIEPPQVGLLGTIKVTIVNPQVTDGDGDAVTTTLVWKVDGVVVPGITGTTAKVKDLAAAGASVQAGSTISVVAVASDGASQVSSVPATVQVVGGDAICSTDAIPCAANAQCTENGTYAPKCACAAPWVGDGTLCLAAGIPAVGIAGEVTQVTADLAIGTGAQGPFLVRLLDADGNVLASGQAVAGKATLQANLPQGSATWTMQVLDVNGMLVAAVSSSVFGDTPPSAPIVTLGPDQPTVQSGVQLVKAEATDPDAGQLLTYTYAWKKNGQPTGIVTPDLAPGVAKKGEEWTLVVVASDGITTGKPGQTSVVIANSPPSPFAASLPEKVGLLGVVAVLVEPMPTKDVDGDALTYTVEWRVDDEVVPGQTGPSLNLPDVVLASGKVLQAGAKITCVVIASDGVVATSVLSDPCIVEGSGADVCKLFNPCNSNALCINNGTLAPLCVCKVGYSGDGLVCDDVNECVANNGGCDANAQCTNVPGSVTCACKAGFTGDGKVCTDVNECEVGNGGCSGNATCSNTSGGFTCSCLAGYTGDGKICNDVDECASNNGGCDVNAACSNSAGGFSCACKTGFSGDGKTCSDVNECAVGNGGCDVHATCANTVGSFGCACNAGFSGDGKTCVDINECDSNNGGCDGNALCTNAPGSFTCTCAVGYEGNGKTCVDVNECQSNNGGCDQDAQCTNTPGSSTCACKPGFSGDGKTCSDVNECSSNNGGCDLNATCTNGVGTFSCACKAGYIGDGKTCSDINECTTDNGGCDANASCTNLPGSSSCACNAGFGGDGKTCADVNECADNNGGCDANAACTNSVGSFSCACKAGYSGDGVSCVDVNECNVGNGGCSANAQCTNAIGSFSCACNPGYTGNGVTCADVNECAVDNGGCSVLVTCTNTLGAFQCGACPSGYTGDGVTCADINECADNNGGCSGLTSCTNTPGSFLCGLCPSGYTGDGVTCTDLNECDSGNGGCDLLTTCTNKPGSFTCGACPSGYTGTGATSCTDVNECTNNNGGCDVLTTCTNKPGTFTCGGCPSGYTGTGATGCTDVNECTNNNGGCDVLTTCTNKPGTFTCGGCPSGYTGTGATGCTDVNECTNNNGGCDLLTTCTNQPGTFACGACPSGYTGTGATSCTDVNECQTNNGGCSANATCTNTPGSLSCACNSGYAGDGVTCTDVNECLTNNGGCSADGICTNTLGSRTCACKTGYTGNGVTCTDVNECQTNNGGCSANATCTNTPGSSSCACNTGYTGNGVTCTDVNECLTGNGGCSADATCTNTQGSRTCACNTGYTGNGVTCTDVNECLVNNGGCSADATCTNTPGSRTCACKTGYAGDGVTCADVNECLTNNGGCSANATCTNTPGSRTCACNAGYSGNGVTCNPAGCSDGTREGFTNATQFTTIAGCSGGFSLAGMLPTTSSQCGLVAGNSSTNPNGTGCSAADLCETGWHICKTSLEVKNSSATAGCTGVTDAGAASLFFSSLQSSQGNAVCSVTGTNDLFGCGNLGTTPNAAACTPLTRSSGDLCSVLGAPWSCVSANGGFDEAIKVVKSGPLRGGVLCCKD
ncbi:MAG: EGF domain-containing protein [Myxococcota bacterium]